MVLYGPCAFPEPIWHGSEVSGVSGSRFRVRTHALDAIEASPNRFGNVYFSSKNHGFGNFLKSLKMLQNPSILTHPVDPGLPAAEAPREQR